MTNEETGDSDLRDGILGAARAFRATCEGRAPGGHPFAGCHDASFDAARDRVHAEVAGILGARLPAFDSAMRDGAGFVLQPDAGRGHVEAQLFLVPITGTDEGVARLVSEPGRLTDLLGSYRDKGMCSGEHPLLVSGIMMPTAALRALTVGQTQAIAKALATDCAQGGGGSTSNAAIATHGGVDAREIRRGDARLEGTRLLMSQGALLGVRVARHATQDPVAGVRDVFSPPAGPWDDEVGEAMGAWTRWAAKVNAKGAVSVTHPMGWGAALATLAAQSAQVRLSEERRHVAGSTLDGADVARYHICDEAEATYVAIECVDGQVCGPHAVPWSQSSADPATFEARLGKAHPCERHEDATSMTRHLFGHRN